MMIKPCCKRIIISEYFSAFVLNGQKLNYMNSFKYLGDIIDNSLYDNIDLYQER